MAGHKQPVPEGDGIYDYRGAAKYLGISVYTLRQKVSAREVAACRQGYRTVRFRRDDLDAYLQRTRVKALRAIPT